MSTTWTYTNVYDYYARNTMRKLLKSGWLKIRLAYDSILILLPEPSENKTNYFKPFAKPAERSLLRVKENQFIFSVESVSLI